MEGASERVRVRLRLCRRCGPADTETEALLHELVSEAMPGRAAGFGRARQRVGRHRIEVEGDAVRISGITGRHVRTIAEQSRNCSK